MVNTIFLVLIVLNLQCTPSLPIKDPNVSQSIITAPHAGLALVFHGQYKSPNHIVHNTAMFPMTADTCYLLPIAALRKIPACSQLHGQIRQKRFIGDIISIGIASTALGTATASIILTKALEREVDTVRTNMQTMSNRLKTGEARMVQFETDQLKMGMALQRSDSLLNATISRTNQHSQILEAYLNKSEKLFKNLQQRIIDNEESNSNRFLYLAIQDIINERSTLAFLHPSDMQKVVQSVLQDSNITVSNIIEQLPLVEMITRLIVRQQIDFISIEKYSGKAETEIGKLIFTTFYAMPNEEKSEFDVYKVFTVPFVHENKIVRLAHMPVYVGINREENTTMMWTEKDLPLCSFHTMITCRSTPAGIPMGKENSCIDQILTGNKLRSCRTEQTTISLPHVQQLQNGRWLISTNNTHLHCIRTQTQKVSTGSAAI